MALADGLRSKGFHLHRIHIALLLISRYVLEFCQKMVKLINIYCLGLCKYFWTVFNLYYLIYQDKWRNLLKASFAQTPPDDGVSIANILLPSLD